MVTSGTHSHNDQEAIDALNAWPQLIDSRLELITQGLINRTYKLTSCNRSFSLQRLSPIFGAEVHTDIARVTQHLSHKSIETPLLVPTRTNDLYTTIPTDEGQSVWRVMTWIDGKHQNHLSHPSQATSVGHLLGRFHAALRDFQEPFVHARLGVHDTPKHLSALTKGLDTLKQHPRYDVIAPIGNQILESANKLPKLNNIPERVVHGDPKVGNIVFDQEGHAKALIDLDTLARMPIVLELGDAFRSWCNRAGENSASNRFDLLMFRASVRGYAQGSNFTLNEQERQQIVTGTQTIMLELAARFCLDALQERYFGWDSTKYPSRSIHNQIRAEGQLSLAADLEQKKENAENIVKLAFSESQNGASKPSWLLGKVSSLRKLLGSAS